MILTLLNLVILTILELLMGWGLLSLFRVDLKPIQSICMSVILGIFMLSVIPFVLAMLSLLMTSPSLYVLCGVVVILLWIRDKMMLSKFFNEFKKIKLTLRIYELPFLIFFLIVAFISIWRCFYLPPTARDLIVGAELISELAVREGSLNSSLFVDEIRISSNNIFKPGFLVGLQIAYKLIGFEFGKLWLSKLFICFSVLLYSCLCKKVHSIVAACLMMFFIMIPDMYAYTFIVLYDYSAAVYFSLGVYFFYMYRLQKKTGYLALSSFLFGASCFVRSDSLFFIAIATVSFLILDFYRDRKLNMSSIKLMIWPIVFVAFWLIFVEFYFPESYDAIKQLGDEVFSLSRIVSVFLEINTELIFGKSSTEYYAWFHYLFFLIFFVELFVFRLKAFNHFIMWVLIIYLGYILLAHLLPLVVIDQTVKRGLFKMFPIMLFYMSGTRLLSIVSDKLNRIK